MAAVLTAYRIVKAKYLQKGAVPAFDGEGARLFGGRWNSPGTPMVYTAQSIALATLEMLVHLDEDAVLPKYKICPVHFDETLCKIQAKRALPKNWSDYPAPEALQALGDIWVKNQSTLVLRVPSVVVPAENNYLINPQHPDFDQLKFSKPVPFQFDARLL